jgi:hypothetical protein
MSADIPNAFIQANLPELKEDISTFLLRSTLGKYGPYVVFENGVKTIYVGLIRALYGMLVAALLWYQQFKKDLEKAGFKFNPYDPCIANRKVNGSTHSVKFHVDDLKSSHIDPKVNDQFHKWLNDKYRQCREVKATRGKVHDYLGMTFVMVKMWSLWTCGTTSILCSPIFLSTWETRPHPHPPAPICFMPAIPHVWTNTMRTFFTPSLQKGCSRASVLGLIYTRQLPFSVPEFRSQQRMIGINCYV